MAEGLRISGHLSYRMRPYFKNKTKQKLKTRLSRLLFGYIIRDYLIKKDYSLSYVHACCEDRRLYEELKFIKIILRQIVYSFHGTAKWAFPSISKQVESVCCKREKRERERSARFGKYVFIQSVGMFSLFLP